MEENAGSLVKLQQAQKLTGLNTEQNIKVLGALNALMIKTGTTGAAAATTMYQLSQALTSGRLAGDEFRAMSENAAGVMNALAKHMDIPREKMKEMAAAGELTSDKLAQAFLKIADSAEGSMEGMPNTFARGWNAVVLAFESMWDRINDENGILGQLANAMWSLADWIENNTDTIAGWALDMKDALVEAWPQIYATMQNLWGMFKTLIGWINQAIEGYQYLYNLMTGNDALLAQAENDLLAQQQFVNKGLDETIEGNTQYYNYDTGNFSSEASSAKRAAPGVTINVSQKVSRSDVVSIATELTRNTARAY
jgi:tape measure domain-containing protein